MSQQTHPHDRDDDECDEDESLRSKINRAGGLMAAFKDCAGDDDSGVTSR